MSGIFSSMNTATKGLMASQTALHTTGHNISNVNTEGFTRQRVDMQADRAFSLAGVGQLGTGVRMNSVVRMIDDHVSKQIRQENSTLNRFLEKSDVLDQLEVIFNEPSDTGLSFNINQVFDAFLQLTENPGDLNSKTVVVEKLKTLTETLNHMAKQIKSLENETHDSIGKNIDDFNSKVEQLDILNKQIFNISIKGQVPNDLLDQRDLLLKDLSAIGEVSTDFDEYGRAEIKIHGNKVLGYNGEKNKLEYKDGEINLIDKENDIVEKGIDVKNGKIKGNFEALEEVKKSKKGLDNTANILAQAMNKVHKDGGGDPIFVTNNPLDTKFTAENITVADAIKTDPGNLKSGIGDDVGNNSIAREFVKLKDKKFSIANDVVREDPSGGNTISGHYRDMVIKTGMSKEHSDNMIKNQIVISSQLEMRRESVSGVSINDEITNVIKFQAAYEANARVITVLTDMLDVLINRTGV